MSRNNRALECSIGDRIGNFIVLRDEYIGKNRTWICECKCGAEKRFWKLSSISRQKSCGCLIDEAGLNGKHRLNSEIGYLPDNVVPCCTKCNRTKSDMTFDEFLDHVEKMHTWLTLNRQNSAVYHGKLKG